MERMNTHGENTKQTWLAAYTELLSVMGSIGIPQQVAKYIAKNLKSQRSIRRMISYIRYARPNSMEDIADEMIAIMEDRENWKRKIEAREANAAYNAWLMSDRRRDDEDE